MMKVVLFLALVVLVEPFGKSISKPKAPLPAYPWCFGGIAGSSEEGVPTMELVGAGFENELFIAEPEYHGTCSLIASVRDGFGSAIVLGADDADMVGSACDFDTSWRWRGIAEHVGHDDASIDEYCANFVPDSSAMLAFSQQPPSELIAAAKEGRFSEIFPGLPNLYIVTARPELGECLLTAEIGVFGMAVCACDSAECNNLDAVNFLVDLDVGPMRLLQFIDGSLASFSAGVNAIVDGLMSEDGFFEPDTVSEVTADNVKSIMLLEGMDALTNFKELWGVVQDFQAQQSSDIPECVKDCDWESGCPKVEDCDTSTCGETDVPSKSEIDEYLTSRCPDDRA